MLVLKKNREKNMKKLQLVQLMGHSMTSDIVSVYGMTYKQAFEEVNKAISFNSGIQKCPVKFTVASMLSDCQEMIERGQMEQARCRLNVCKMVLFSETEEVEV
jgi:hypothetical protein